MLKTLVPEIVTNMYKEFNATNDERFWMAGLAELIGAGVLMSSTHAGIIDIPMGKIIEFLHGIVTSMRNNIKGNARSAEDVLNTYTRDHYGSFIVIRHIEGNRVLAELGSGKEVDDSTTRARIMGRIDGWLPLRSAHTLRQLSRDTDRVLSAWLRGQLLCCLVLGLFYAIGLQIVGLELGLMVGLMAGLLSFIPYVGSITGFVVAVLLAAAQFGTWEGVWLVVAVFVLGQFVEGYVIYPRLLGDRVELHAVWVIFALFAGGVAFNWPTLWLVERLGGLRRQQIVAGMALGSGVAVMCDGLAITWAPWLYGGISEDLSRAAAWLLWTVGVGLVLAFIFERR
jgi:hypothetical protein